MRLAGRSAVLVAVNVGIFLLLAVLAPGYFTATNLINLFFENLPVLIVALGMLLVILTGQIDISVGSIYAIAGIAAGLLVKAGVPTLFAAILAGFAGAFLGSVNGALVAYLRIPSIVVTLATMITLRDGLRWATEGAWVTDLPEGFQWFGLPEQWYVPAMLLFAVALTAFFAWSLRSLHAGRSIYATGSNAEAARLAGIPTKQVTFAAFALLGLLTGAAAVLNAVRFSQIPSNAGLGLELKAIAAVVVGGAAITGGAGTVTGTILGVVLLGAIGPALTFLGVSPYWEKAIQGAIILVSLAIEVLASRSANTPGRVAVKPS